VTNFEINKSIGFASSLCSQNTSYSLLVAGNFNFPDINWYHSGGVCKNKGRPSSLDFLDCLNMNYLTQHNCLHSSIRWSYELRSNTGASAFRFPRPVYSKGNYSLFNEKFLDCRDRLSSDDADSSYNLLVSSCKKVKAAVRKAICKFEAFIVRSCKLQPKLLFNYINSQKACNDSIKGLLDADGCFQTDDRVIVRLLNEHFSSVFSLRDYGSVPAMSLKHQMRGKFGLLSPGNVIKQINRLNPRKSPGQDCIHPFVVKSCAKGFAETLSVIFVQSFISGKTPDLWKRAQVTPIFKKGSSLVDFPNCIAFNKLIAPGQHGFVLKKSTITYLLETADRISEGIDNCWNVLVVFLDFAKAFDKVCHESLCNKVAAYDFEDRIVKWIRNFLLGRKQRVAIGQYVADSKEVTSVVPQGSVLGPLLFVIYINDMPDIVNHVIKLFADDSKLIATIRNVNDLALLQRDLDALTEWSTTWRMLFNIEKCKVMECSRSGQTKYSDKDLCMGVTRSVLNQTSTEKDLGVTFASNLKFSSHIKAQTNKAISILGQLRRTFKFWTNTTFITL
ncbi:RNA-directed DNA polymerase from mobile element jockey-like, partial [Brachionus plicatilis]